jgi:DNA-binding winged helix-turn-helix (wHTH) protein
MSTSYEIGPFRLDTEAEILYRGTEPVAVGQRAVALLGVLVESAGTPGSAPDQAWVGEDR